MGVPMSSWGESIRKNLGFASPIFTVLTILNFFAFVGLTIHWGGDALIGKIDAGRYFLWGYNVHSGEKGYTEVSAAIFKYSRWHAYSVIITWLIMLASGVAVRGGIRRPKKLRG